MWFARRGFGSSDGGALFGRVQRSSGQGLFRRRYWYPHITLALAESVVRSKDEEAR